MNTRIQVQGKFGYPTPAAKESCRATSESFFVIFASSEGTGSVPMFDVRIPMAEFDNIADARACAETISAALALGTPPSDSFILS